MKKAYELSTLTGTQVLLLVASETGHVYTFATPKLQPLISKPEGQNLIQACLNSTPESGTGEGMSGGGSQRGKFSQQNPSMQQQSQQHHQQAVSSVGQQQHGHMQQQMHPPPPPSQQLGHGGFSGGSSGFPVSYPPSLGMQGGDPFTSVQQQQQQSHPDMDSSSGASKEEQLQRQQMMLQMQQGMFPYPGGGQLQSQSHPSQQAPVPPQLSEYLQQLMAVGLSNPAIMQHIMGRAFGGMGPSPPSFPDSSQSMPHQQSQQTHTGLPNEEYARMMSESLRQQQQQQQQQQHQPGMLAGLSSSLGGTSNSTSNSSSGSGGTTPTNSSSTHPSSDPGARRNL